MIGHGDLWFAKALLLILAGPGLARPDRLGRQAAKALQHLHNVNLRVVLRAKVALVGLLHLHRLQPDS